MGTEGGRAPSRAMAVRERTALHALLSTLDDAQWAASSLCAGWSVRDVAVHVVSYDDLSWGGLGATMLRARLRPDAANELLVRRHLGLSADSVLALVADRLEPRGLPALLGGDIALADGTIHHQDIRRALRLPREIPAEQLRAVLGIALRAPTLPARRNARGLRLAADDLDWEHGDGPEVRGPGEALLMAVAGRAPALDELAGPGLPVLAARVTA